MPEKPIERVQVGDRILVDAGTLAERAVTVTANSYGIACARGGKSYRMNFVHWDEDGVDCSKMGYAGTMVRLAEEADDAGA